MSDVLEEIWDLLKELRNHTKTFFLIIGLIFILSGFYLTQIPGEKKHIPFGPYGVFEVTATQALGYLFIGIGFVFWMAIVGSLVASGEERQPTLLETTTKIKNIPFYIPYIFLL